MDTSKIVGEKIKSLRESQSISMEELAQRSGLAIEQIERIENNIDLPSLAPLIKIARVLGVRLGTFLDDQDENGPVVCRKSEAKDSISFSNNAIHSRKHMEYHSLSKSKADRHMEPFIIDVAPTDDSDFVLSSHEGEEFIMVMEGTMEFIYVLEGVLEINYGKNTYILEEGDSIYYDSIVPHHVHAYEGQAAKILAVIYTPI
jgi:transcriptional regulator with XRE-family HTH domain